VQNTLASSKNTPVKQPHKKKAASSTYKTVSQYPIVGPELALLAAAAFAGTMAFMNSGGTVPGIGNSDSVSAMLTPGEAVLPKGLTERPTKATGDSGVTHETHIHIRPTNNVQAFDSRGIDTVMNEHASRIAHHVSKHMRKQNRS